MITGWFDIEVVSGGSGTWLSDEASSATWPRHALTSVPSYSKTTTKKSAFQVSFYLWLLLFFGFWQWGEFSISHSYCHQYRTDLPNHQQIGLFNHHWPVNQWRTETSIRSGHLDAHALMSTNSVWTCTSIAPAWTSCPTWTFCPLGQTGGPPVFPAPHQCSPGHLGVVIIIVIIIILIAITSYINLCRWTAGFLVWTSMLGTMVVLTYVTK